MNRARLLKYMAAAFAWGVCGLAWCAWLAVFDGDRQPGAGTVWAAEPPAVNPFGEAPTEREDATPGYVEMSDGTIYAGLIYLTRDKRLQISDEKLQRQREVPLRVVKQIDCKVVKEWMEKEWRFKELTLNEKLYTGRSYPAREYVHVITLQDGRTIEGGLSGVLYVQPFREKDPQTGQYKPHDEPLKLIIHKRHKGEIGEDLKSLKYVKLVKLGEAAYKEGKQKAEAKQKSSKQPS